ncbi:hypothetical protein Taro_008968, partial [Colocasia esculenta]|nr:hypothetical protein [Colocasia esculenta]
DDLTVELGKETCPMSPSGLLKATGPMSPSQFQRVKCPSREHKPQFVPCLEKTFSSGELKLGSSVEAWEEVVWPSCKGCAGLGVAILMATPGLSPSQSEKGLGNLLSVLLPLRLDFLGTCVRRGTVVRPDYGSCGYLWFRVSLRREVSDMDRWSRVRLHSSSLHGVARRRARSNRSVSPSGSPDPWAAVPTVGSLVGAGDLGAGAVIVIMPPRTRRQAHNLVECQETESDSSVAAEQVPFGAQPQQFEQPDDPLPQGGALQTRVSSVFVLSSLRERAVAAVLTVRPWIFQQVLEAQSADEDLADVLRLPEADLTVEQGKATCPMSPSGLLKATGPMSPSQFQRVKCPSREHKPQFVPWLEKTFSSGELKLGSSVEAWEEVVWPSCKRVLLQTAGFARVVDFGSSRGKRWDSDEVVCGALLAETGTPVVPGTVVRPDYGSCGYLWFRVSLRREVSDMDRWSRLGSCGALVYTGETSQQFPPQRSEETGPQ